MFILDLSVSGPSGPSESKKPPETKGAEGQNLNRTEGASDVARVISDIVSNPFANFYKYFEAAKEAFNLSDKDAHKVARLTAKRYGDQIPTDDKGISLDRNL